MKPYFLESIVAASVIALSGCGDNPNEVRKVDCVGTEQIKAEDLIELDKSISLLAKTPRNVAKICSARYDISDGLNRGFSSIANTTIVVDRLGDIYTLTKAQKDFLLPKKEVTTKKGVNNIKPEEEKLKYPISKP